MADNVTVTAGAGTTILADELTDATLGTGKAQIIKIMDGTLDSSVRLKICAEDGAHVSGDTGIMGLAVRQDTPGALSGTDGDYEPLQISGGLLWTRVRGLQTPLGDSVLDDTNDCVKTSVVTALPAGTNAIGKLAANSGVDIGDVDVTSIAAGTNHIGQMTTPGKEVEVTLSLDTIAYADGDVLADTQEIAAAARANGQAVELRSIAIIDEDDQKQGFDIIFFKTNVSLGTENAAPSITDANARQFVGLVKVSAGEYIDLGGVAVACVPGNGLEMVADSASTSLWFACISRGTGTYTASGIRIKFNFWQG